MATITTGVIGWHIHSVDNEYGATFIAGDKTPLFSVTGFQSRREAAEFVATYFLMLSTRGHNNETTINDMIKRLTLKQS